MGALDGKTALVTGAGRGIGRAIAERLARDGAMVAVHYGSSEAAATDTVETINSAGGQAFTVHTKLGEPGDAEALWAAFDQRVAAFSDSARVDVIVNNAGVALYAPIGDVADKSFDEVFAVNAKAPFFILQHGLARLSDGGRIINISSGSARQATPMLIAYSMTKGALNALTRTLALELGPRNITVNAVEPGIVETDIAFFLSDPRMHGLAESWSAFNRLGQPDDIADVVAFLASPDGRWITGQCIDASGGLLLGPTF